MDKSKWNHQLRLTLRSCIQHIQLPALKASLLELWQNLNNVANRSKNKWERGELGQKINRGLRRGANKLFSKYATVSGKITKNSCAPFLLQPPPPPPPLQSPRTCIQTEKWIQPTEKQLEPLEIETGAEVPLFKELTRGEEFTPLRNFFEIYKAITPSKDIARILAFGIFGSKKKVTFLYRSLYKYMGWYEEKEREAFKPGLYTTREGKKKYVYRWVDWLEVVQKGKCSLNKSQIIILAKLYQLQVRFFTLGKEKGQKYVCVDQTEYLQHRVINILEINNEGWTILQGTTTPVLKFDNKEGKYDLDFYLAGCEMNGSKEVRSKNRGVLAEIDSKEREIVSTESDRLESPKNSESIERLQAEIEHPLALRDRILSDTTSSNLLSPSSIERRLEVEREVREIELSQLDEDSELQSLFPTELIITKPKRKRTNRREAWQLI